VHLQHFLLILTVCMVQDLVVGYMGVPKYPGVPMTRHPQYITVRCVFLIPP
jgi:hypothetical protein